jgi:hypothetical protein
VAHLVTQPAVATGGATKKRLQIHGEHALHLENRTTRKLCSLRTRLSCSAQRRMPELPVVLRTRRTLHLLDRHQASQSKGCYLLTAVLTTLKPARRNT